MRISIQQLEDYELNTEKILQHLFGCNNLIFNQFQKFWLGGENEI